MSREFEVRYSVSAPGSVLTAEYDASNEQVVVAGAGFCGVRVKSVSYTHLTLPTNREV